MVDIKKIEDAYIRTYKVKEINKSTKKWKKFYNAYRKEVKKTFEDEVKRREAKKKVSKPKSKKKMKIPSSFNYNKVKFIRIPVARRDLDYIKTKRKYYKKDGYYTKVVKFENKLFLYASETKRPKFKSKSKKYSPY